MEQKRIEFTIPLPPSVNHLYSNRVVGRRIIRYITSRGKRWFNEAGLRVFSQIKKRRTIKRPVSVYIKMYHNRERDIDNILKATLDLFEKIRLIENDKQVEFLQVWKTKDKNPRLEIELIY